MNDCIIIKNVDKFYGKKQALSDISLTIEKGMFGLLGRNGAGKTTLMKTLAALHKKNSGEITVCGVPVENAAEIRAMTGYLPQEFSMYPNMRTDEALDYLGALSGMPSKLRKERVESLLKRVNLTEHRRKKVKELSGGMKRRLGIAQAIIHDPKVLIVDEPTAGLDPEERIRFRNLLCELAEDRIVLLSTHIVGDVEATCEKIAVMDSGRILWKGTVSELIENARGHVYTANVEKRFLPQLKKEYIVTGMLAQNDYTTVRIVSDPEPDLPNTVQTEPDLEGAYMYCLHSSGCDVSGGEDI
ncbi:MAG: ABC transporter ATP-binding protein [Ruminococcus sp.]|nr:ABC transporter ATP-binding protein [Ruminococcus sp.]